MQTAKKSWRWWLLVPGLAALALAGWAWSGQSAQMQVLDSLRTPVIAVCFVAAPVEFWLAQRRLG